MFDGFVLGQDARRVDQDIEAAVLAIDLRRERVERVPVGDVYRVGPRDVDAGDDGAGLLQECDAGFPDARRRSGHDGDLSLQAWDHDLAL